MPLFLSRIVRAHCRKLRVKTLGKRPQAIALFISK